MPGTQPQWSSCVTPTPPHGSEFAAPPVRLHFCVSQAELNQDFADHMGFIESAYGLRRGPAAGCNA